ncbi:hypothetical protein SDC9_177352 [bioreactor metagenome]|uniref:Uncharacterized protein n=1 Tax=bioreactor metagenome TaxID=1076179 RepID=A0A645GSS8_9ZZZZ
MTGAVAAIALPPQIEEPTPIRVEMREGIFIARYMIYAKMSDVAIVDIIIGSDCAPTRKISDRFMPKPRSTTAHCSIFFDVKLTPA